ncbi:hypothetical protein [Halobacillus massiliensis]|uniref:hypothetical protein n=1 Tax=Halobacillus massiliensis TaxID=1926286 RepID=UPI0009E4EE6D|nr:hypothetical protein [Halobacillus massiliensis]
MDFTKILTLLGIIILLLFGCSNSGTTRNPSPEDFLKNEDADIFLLDGIVYSNVHDVEWVQELDYTLGGQIGEINKQSDKAWSFNNGSANKLPVGTKIYETDTPVSIAIVNATHIPYLKMIEG